MSDRAVLYAVLTGDLVKSSRLTAKQSQLAMARVRDLAREFLGTHPGATIGQVDTFRHDSWQWLLARPLLALRAAVFMRAGVRALSDARTKFDTRIAIGIGMVEAISKRRISDSRGLAFTLSGKALDAMKDERLAYAGAAGHPLGETCFSRGVAPLLDCVVTDWTAVEARAVHGALMGWTQEETAAHWPAAEKTHRKPTRQAIGKSLARAHWAAVENVLEWAESIGKQPPKVADDHSNPRGLHSAHASSSDGAPSVEKRRR